MITEHNDLVPDDVIESLRRIDLFKGLSDDDLRALVDVLKGFKAGPGDHLFDEGDEDDKFFLVTAGAVEIVKAGSSPELCVKERGSSSMLRLGCLGELLGLEE